LLVKLNGAAREVLERSTLDDLVAELSLTPARIAVELNQLVVRRDKWRETILSEGDRIEIVHFVGGGAAGPGSQPAGLQDSSR
jgi:thiamine biosynthesis protein ThiS